MSAGGAGRQRQPGDALSALPVARGSARSGQRARPRAPPSTTSEDRLRPAGELARATPTPLSVADVLNKVPPHLLGDQIVAEAQRIAGVSSAAVYLVDLEGVRLMRLAGPTSFPETLPAKLAVGTEIPREGLPALRGRRSRSTCPAPCRRRSCCAVARWGRSSRSAATPTASPTSRTRRRRRCRSRRTTPTTSTPPAACGRRARRPRSSRTCCRRRIVRTNGALIAGNVLPGYEIGGDWFDYAENPAGTWIGMADAEGSGTRAAALASVALGAFRSGRHQSLDLPAMIRLMDTVVREFSEGGDRHDARSASGSRRHRRSRGSRAASSGRSS